MRITLIKLVLDNFKGVKHFELDTKGKSVTVRGDNRTGKTTLADAFSWVLFGKDFKDKADFGIKPTDAHGNEILGLEPSVECELLVDDKRITFKRLYKETKSGGNTTDYFIKDIPVKKSEYEAYIAEIIDLNTFKLLTNPMYFLNLHWEKQRETLLEVCGDLTDEEIIAANSSLAKLPDLLTEHSIQELERLLGNNKKVVNKERESLPARISEAKRSIADVSGLDANELQAQLDELNAQKRIKEQELVRTQSGSEVIEKQKQITQLDTETIKLRNEYMTKWQSDKHTKQKALDETRAKARAIEGQISLKQSDVKADKATITRIEGEMTRLRAKWHEVNNQEFNHCQEDNCPTCGQSLPADKVAEATAKALAAFNSKKSQELQQINQTGMDQKTSLGKIQQTISQHEVDIKILNTNLNAINNQIHAIEAEVKDAEQHLSKVDSLDEVSLKRKSELQVEIAQLQENAQPAIDVIQAEIVTLEADIEKIKDQLTDVEFDELGKKRVKELLEQEKRLAAKSEEIDGHLSMIAEFHKVKVAMLATRINSKFQLVKWKLFEEQANGNIKETCQAMINGVPYGKGLNTEGQFNAGLEIINTLSEHYNFVAPITIDNAEAVTEFVPTEAQLIKLVKPEIRTKVDAKKYSKLVVEVDEQEQKQGAV